MVNRAFHGGAEQTLPEPIGFTEVEGIESIDFRDLIQQKPAQHDSPLPCVA